MVLLEPERTLNTLPLLLSGSEDRERVMFFLEWGRKLDGVTRGQHDMIDRIVDLIDVTAQEDKPARTGGKKR
jgi:hypothetical protein